SLPCFGLMTDVAALVHLEQCDAPVGGQIPQFVRFLAIDLTDGRDLLAELRIQAGVKTSLDEKQDTYRKNAHDERQHASVPECKPRAHARRPESHSCLPLRRYPRPRTVCSSFRS